MEHKRCILCSKKVQEDWNPLIEYHPLKWPENANNLCNPHKEVFYSWWYSRTKHIEKWDLSEEYVVEWIAVLVKSGAKRKISGGPVAFCQQITCKMWAKNEVDGLFLCNAHLGVKNRGNLLILDNEEGRQPILDAVMSLLGE